MFDYLGQPGMFQQNHWQVPGWFVGPTAVGTSSIYGYLDALYFFDGQTDVIRVPGELQVINVLDTPTVVYASGNDLSAYVEFEQRIVYAPRNFD